MRNWCCEDGRGHWQLEEAVCSVPRQVLSVTNELWGCSCRQLLKVATCSAPFQTSEQQEGQPES